MQKGFSLLLFHFRRSRVHDASRLPGEVDSVQNWAAKIPGRATKTQSVILASLHDTYRQTPNLASSYSALHIARL